MEQAGYTELASAYNRVFLDEQPYAVEKISSMFPDIVNWMDEHEEIIQKFYFDVLKTHFFKNIWPM